MNKTGMVEMETGNASLQKMPQTRKKLILRSIAAVG